MVPQKKKTGKVRTTALRVPDEELIARLEEDAPEVFSANMEVVFDATVRELLKESLTHEAPHFYSRPYGEYLLKSHPHRRSPRGSGR